VRAFKLTEKQSRPGGLEILVEGEVDLAVCEQWSGTLRKAAERQDVAYVLIDLAQAEANMVAEGQELRVFGAAGQAQRILAQTELIAMRSLSADRRPRRFANAGPG
jgi:hypothetical protein